MHSVIESSDTALLDLMRQRGSLGVAELASAMRVTATAVRQRLARLMGNGLIERDVAKGRAGPTEPSLFAHREGDPQYRLELRRLGDRLVERGAADQGPGDPHGIDAAPAQTMAGMYGGQIRGDTVEERMASVGRLLGERNIPFAVDRSGQLPVLTALACPYPELAEQDRGICAVEKLVFSELLGEKVRLTECRLDGASNCCRFETN